MGWMRRSNFREEDETSLDWLVKQKIARKLADLILESGIVLYRQWFRGKDNVVADSLSRDLYFMSSHTHILFLRRVVPNQIPQNFNIKPVQQCKLLEEQYRAYERLDPDPKKQKAIPVAVLRYMWQIAATEKEKNIAELLIGALFFCMRSCEYLITCAKESNKRTRILRLRNFSFQQSGRHLNHVTDTLELAQVLRITFEFQENDKKFKGVHMYRTEDPVLCPVKAWARVIKRIYMNNPKPSKDTKICEIKDEDGQIRCLISGEVRSHLRAIVAVIGADVLGFTAEDIGLHSIRSGGAMAMFLSGVADIIIQRVGRWSSLAFLEYIQEQVDRFTAGVSARMIQQDMFVHLNSIEAQGVSLADENDIDNGDGVSTVPFTAHISDEVLLAGLIDEMSIKDSKDETK